MLRRLTILVALVGACAAQNNSDNPMIVLNNSAVIAGALACQFTGDINQPFISHGEINSKSPNPYIINPLIESRITAVTGQESQRTIQVQGADVSLSVAGGGVTLPMASFQVLASAFIAPNNGTTNVSFDLVPLADLMAIDAALGTASGSTEVVANITIKGSLGGDTVHSEPFSYGVTVCNSCVVDVIGACPVMGAQISLGNICNPFQDGIVDCCTKNGTTICPATTQ